MKNIIKSFVFAVCFILCSNAFAAKKSIVCVTYPEYDWVMNILGKNASNFNVVLLQNNGTDLHSYQPSVRDIARISTCDLLIYVGGESDEWVEKAVKNAKNKNMKVVNMLEVLGDKVREEEVVEGMQAEDEHEHEHSHEHNESFSEADVKARSLKEWNGEWQSTYPYLLSGELDEVWEHKAEHDEKMSSADYKEKYTKAYVTDELTIKIKAPYIEYVTKNGSYKAKYEYAGSAFRIRDDGRSQAKFKFEKKSGSDKAAKYIIFSDHNFEPAVPEHFHFYESNESFEEVLWDGVHFPTYYPASLSGEDIVDELIGHHHEEVEYDEHVWLSVKNAIELTNAISVEIMQLDSENASHYKNNTVSYVKQLADLDAEFEKVVRDSAKKTVLFGDRYPFRYLTDDYKLNYFAAFVGCSAESEASFETIAFLAKKLDELGLNAVITIEKSDKKIAKTIVASTKNKNQEILEMDSLQSVAQKEIAGGRNYLSAMKNNLEVLKKALK